MSFKQALEMARCVEITIDRMIDVLPPKMYPIVSLAALQIKECVKELELEEESNERG